MRGACAVILLAVLAAATGCGNSAPAPSPNAGNASKSKEAPKKSYRADYDRESGAAFTAWKRFGDTHSDDDYITSGEHIYAALKFYVLHEKENGDGSASNFSKLQELKQLRGDWYKTNGPKDDPRIDAAIKDWDAAKD